MNLRAWTRKKNNNDLRAFLVNSEQYNCLKNYQLRFFNISEISRKLHSYAINVNFNQECFRIKKHDFPENGFWENCGNVLGFFTV